MTSKTQPVILDRLTGAHILKVHRSNGQVYHVLIDACDWVRVVQYNWGLSFHKGLPTYTTRAVKNASGSWGSISLHRFLMDAEPGQIVDHKNRNTLDHRRCNLRFATPRQNVCNQSVHKVLKTSRFKGVSWRMRNNAWRAAIRRGGKNSAYLGIFKSEEDAARAYDVAALKQHGEFAFVNFPTQSAA